MYQLSNPTVTNSTATISRQDVINWINSLTLKFGQCRSKQCCNSTEQCPQRCCRIIKIEKLEDLVDGFVICILFNTLFPDYINEGRIKPNSPYYDDRLKNWKLAQNVLDKLNIELEIKVDLILKGNTAQLLRIAQWLILFCEENKLSKSKVTSPIKDRNILIKSSKIQQQEQIIKSLSAERDEYYTKLADIENEIKIIKNANITEMLFGISTNELCDRLNQILSQ